ncbi:MAG: transglutaminase-like domain-containing protein [Lentisphaerae bacterium]|nr:transglutaminase-like domain-containing protein [Lentisphaerota bacterium]
MANSYSRTVQLNAGDLRWICDHHPGWPHGVSLVGYDNPAIVRSRYPMQYQPLPCPELAQLREAHALDAVVRDAQGDMDYFLALSQWVRSHWKFGIPDEGEPAWDAAYLIARGQEGQPLHCICAAVVFIQAMQALGRHARLLNVRKPGDTRLWQYEPLHALTEAYSDEFGKWVVVDPNCCSMFTRKDSPIPLNALELHNLILAGGGGEVRAHQRQWTTFEGEERMHLDAPGRLAEYVTFFTRFVVGTANNFFERAASIGRPVHDYTDLDLYSRLAWYDGQTPLRESSQATDDPDDLYPSVNRVHLDLTFEQKPEGLVEVLLTHCVPNLEHFEVQIDGGAWLKVGSGVSERVLNWRLHPGRNVIKARGRNTLGLATGEAAITLEYIADRNA